MKIVREAGMFSIIGVLNTLLTLGIIFIAKYVGGFGDITANVLGYAAGILQSFLLNERFTFKYAGNRPRAVARFLTIVGGGYLLNLGTVALCIYVIEINADLAHLIGMPVYTAATFLASKYWAFASEAPPRAGASR